MSDTIPTWGYHPTEEPRIFDLKPGEKLPEGWADTPAAFAAPAALTDKPTPPAKKSTKGK